MGDQRKMYVVSWRRKGDRYAECSGPVLRNIIESGVEELVYEPCTLEECTIRANRADKLFTMASHWVSPASQRDINEFKRSCLQQPASNKRHAQKLKDSGGRYAKAHKIPGRNHAGGDIKDAGAPSERTETERSKTPRGPGL